MILAEASAAGTLAGGGGLIIMLVLMGGMMYFMIYRPQKKEQKRVSAMLNEMKVGDSVVTTGGFYGVIIDITEEDVIIEFGNNKNCRIPMRKAAISEVESAEAAVVSKDEPKAAVTDKTDKKDKKDNVKK